MTEEIISNIEMFKDASPELHKILSIACKSMSVKRGAVIFSESEEGNYMYAVIRGFVRLVKSTVEGKEILVRLVKPYETFAEVILFESKEYPVTAIAGDDTDLVMIHKRSVYDILEKENFRNDFLSMLMRRMRYLTERILYVSAFDVEERFFRFLIDRYGKKQEYTISMAKKDIASAIGTIPETMSRLLMRLKTRKMITWEGEVLTLKKGFWEENSYE
jgi:CRP-like cAMP-binding protein